MAGKTAQQVLDEHVRDWMAIPGVIGAGIGRCDGQPCLKVFIAESTPAIQDRFPTALEGFCVILEESGEIRALKSD